MELIDLWIPIVACAFAVFMCSFLAWAISPHHRNDWRPLPKEIDGMSSIRSLNLPPGVYMFPFSHSKKDSREYTEKFKAGPSGELKIWPMPNMPKYMFLTFMVFLIATITIGYVAAETMECEAPFMRVFQLVGTMGLLTYCFSFLPNFIWFASSRQA